MRTLTVLALLASTMVLTGCTCSVHPILNESDLTKDVDLTGTWELEAKNPRGKRTFSAEALSDKSEYDITFDGNLNRRGRPC